MKNQMKLIMLFTVLVCALSNTNSAYGVAHIETSDKATKGEAWNFELYNKSGQTVTLTLSHADALFMNIMTNQRISNKGKLRASGIKTEKVLDIQIMLNDGTVIRKGLVANGKTVYLTLDEKGRLRPQTGTLMGLSGKTDSGLDNKNNISPLGIQDIK